MSKTFLKIVWNSDLVVMLRRLGILYLIFFIARLIFYIYNTNSIGTLSFSEGWTLLRGATQFDTVSIIYSFGPFMLLSLIPFRVREKRWWQGILKWYFIVAATAVTAMNLADAIYFRYTQSRFCAGDIFFANNDNTTQLMGQFAAENWYLIIVLIALVWLMFFLWKHSGKPRTSFSNKYAYIGINLVIMCLALTAVIWAVRGGSLSRYTRPITLSNASAYTNSSTKATMILSNPFCILRTMGNRETVDADFFAPEEVEKIFTPIHRPSADSTSFSSFGSLKGRNIMIFVLESFSAEHSGYLNPDLYPDGKGYIPFLDSLMREGWTMGRSYANGRKSIEALPSILGSIPSFKTPFVLMPESLGEGRQLPKILKDNGYSTAFFCGSPRGSMGFEAYATASGMDRLYSMTEFHERRSGGYDGYWGLWDEEFFDYTGEILGELPQPFFGSLFSISSHHPFVIPEQYENVIPKGKTKVHRGVGYTDLSLRKFFEKYSKEDWFQNTLFVFVADHVSSERYAEKCETPRGRQHIITAFYTPDGALKGYESSVFQQLDIMPTLLGLLGNTEPYFAFGRDVLNEHEREPFAISYGGGLFVNVSDSLAVIYNDQEKKIVGSYGASDVMMTNNIMSEGNEQQKHTERLFKAVLQQYYTHLKSKDYLVK